MKEDSTLRKKVEGELPEQDSNLQRLVKASIKSFLESESNYGAITDIKGDTNQIYTVLKGYIEKEKVDVYALKLDDRIILSKTIVGFEDLYELIKNRSELQVKKDGIEIWDDAANEILHLIVVPVEKHFPIEYSTTKHKTDLTEKISSMTQQPC
jgi:hypothetical protein